jgi:hypothetical protein
MLMLEADVQALLWNRTGTSQVLRRAQPEEKRTTEQKVVLALCAAGRSAASIAALRGALGSSASRTAATRLPPHDPAHREKQRATRVLRLRRPASRLLVARSPEGDVLADVAREGLDLEKVLNVVEMIGRWNRDLVYLRELIRRPKILG